MQILNNIFNDNVINVMVDLETLGTKPGCKVISIGLASFNEHGSDFATEIYPGLSYQYGHIDADTLDWWENQSPEAKTVFMKNSLYGVHVGECAAKISEFIGMVKKERGLDPDAKCKINMWGNGATFDLTILEHLFTSHGATVPWNTFGDRCYRTAINLLGKVKLERQGTSHCAVDDAVHQALCLVMAIKSADDAIKTQ